MAELIRGKARGKQVKVLQWCNDWFSVEIDGVPKIVSPLALKLDEEEAGRVASSVKLGRSGTLAAEYCLRDDGTFARRLLVSRSLNAEDL